MWVANLRSRNEGSQLASRNTTTLLLRLVRLDPAPQLIRVDLRSDRHAGNRYPRLKASLNQHLLAFPVVAARPVDAHRSSR